MIKVRFFGKLRDSLGDEREIDSAEGETVAALRRRLAAEHPHASADLLGPRTRACVNDSIADEDFVLAGNERVEFLPPLSGG